MRKVDDKMFVLGRTNTKEVYLISQSAPFLTSEYLMIEDLQHGNVPVEVFDTFAYPMVVSSVLPEGTAVEFLNVMNINATKPVFLAKASVLPNLTTPITPASKVRKPSFDEVEDILIVADPDKSFTIGVIEGTSHMYDELPSHLQNVAPGWRHGAIPQSAVPFFLDFHKFREYPHIGMFGSSGSGKSFGLRVLEEEMMNCSIPALSFDPHMESVFERPISGLSPEQQRNYRERYEVFHIGKNVGIRFVELELDELVHLFSFVGALSEPQRAALEALYEKGDTLSYLKQRISDLKVAFEENDKPQNKRGSLTQEQEMLYTKYRNRVSGASTLQALSWKLDALEHTNIFDGDVSEVERAIRQRKLAVIRGDVRRLQMLSSYIIKKFYHKRRVYQDAREQGKEAEYFPMFFVIVDEAHNFAPKQQPSPIKNVLRTVALEARKYGVFLLMVTQKPDSLDDVIVAQLNTKIIYRLNTADEMEIVKKETNLREEEVRKLPDLPSGSCFISSPILPKTFSISFRTTFSDPPNTKDPFEELNQFSVSADREDLASFLLTKKQVVATKMAELHKEVNQQFPQVYNIKDISDTLNDLVRSGKFKKEQTPMGVIYRN